MRVPFTGGYGVHHSVRLKGRQLLCTISPVEDVRGDPVQLGRELADARAEARESLKTVSVSAGVSAAYLQKLERGQVETPSPRILRALGAHLNIPYRRLMELAGYEVPTRANATQGALAKTLASASLSQSEERAVAAFVEHLLDRRPGNLRRER
jgi:transcriptional regulator with XRE-family HTH domain